MCQQPAQLCTGLGTFPQLETGLEVVPGLAPQLIAQRQAAQAQQQYGVVGPLRQPLLGNQQLTLRIRTFNKAVQSDQIAIPAALELALQQGHRLCGGITLSQLPGINTHQQRIAR